MPVDLAALVALVLSVMGVIGIIIPVLPGSIFVAVGALVWAIWGNAPLPWLWFSVAVLAVLIGSIASTVLTGKNLKSRGIPSWPIFVALVAGVVASFFVPVIGLFAGFVVTLVACELLRVKSLSKALKTSWVACTSVGTGMLIELACALLACNLLAVAIVLPRLI